ncbi:hypothetical protein DI005_01130 [Prauserella sp. PE36]|uniref:DMT family transporter n=1 Tax=Prauserella sp. PE36 TaxID=1504709 RepID=UPI000DE3FB07|nr:DMT family transporter [Prauserella sp. PE36]RBM24166.1 hypothetical protein DI005_01130 [Prauserella sp. PE36]
MALTVVLAVLAALANATASVLQRKGARRQADGRSMSVGTLWHLAHDAFWLAGVATIFTGFVLQAAALATGPITLIQPLLVTELGLTLVLSSFLLHTRLRAREWSAVAGMSAGIALLLVSLRPSSGKVNDVPLTSWLLGAAVTLAVIGTLVAIGYRYRGTHRAAYLGVASGMYFGFLAALVSGMTAAFADGIGGVFGAWQTYAVLVVGPTGFLLLQNTLRAGSLVASQPGLTLANPLVSIGWGVAVFGEHVQGGGWIAGQVIGAALIAACTLLLVRSPLLQGESGEPGESEVDEPAEPPGLPA